MIFCSRSAAVPPLCILCRGAAFPFYKNTMSIDTSHLTEALSLSQNLNKDRK
jgi:hypothetical protein